MLNKLCLFIIYKQRLVEHYMSQSLQKLDEKFFAKFRNVQQFKKNQLIFGPGSEPTGVYFVKSGFVRLYLISKEGKEITFNILKPDTYFSMIWALNNASNIYFYETLTDCVLLKAPKEAVVKQIEKNPDLLYDLTKRTLSGLDGITRLMSALLTGTAGEHIASVLLILTRRFGKKEHNGSIIIEIPLTHMLIGTLAGLSRESTSLELEKLAKKNVLSQKGRYIIIENIKKLEDLSPITYIENAIY